MAIECRTDPLVDSLRNRTLDLADKRLIDGFIMNIICTNTGYTVVRYLKDMLFQVLQEGKVTDSGNNDIDQAHCDRACAKV